MIHRLSSRTRLAALLLALPSCCLAAPSPPFDVGALIIWVSGYFVGLIVLLVSALRSKRFRVALAVYVIAPVVWIAIEVIANNRHNAKVLAETEAGEKANEQAFSRYCKDRQRKVLKTAPPKASHPEKDRAVYVRFESNFTADKLHFNAGVIAHYLQVNPTKCAQTGLWALEGKYDGAYVQGKGYTPEIRRYDACAKTQVSVIPTVEARYELVLGETGRKDSVPWGGEWGRWMSRTSVRVVDRQDASTLAEDTLYFLRYESGVGGCPKAQEQLAELLSGVFSLPER